MKKTLYLGLVSLVLYTLVSFSFKTEVGGFDAIVQNIKNTKAYTIDVLEALPDIDYDYRPTAEVRTFAEQAAHIAYATEGFADMFMKKNPDWKSGDGTKLNRQELIDLNRKNFDRIIEVVENASYDDGLHKGIISFLDHNAHHRGQMIIYLRMKGIEPPAYR